MKIDRSLAAPSGFGNTELVRPTGLKTHVSFSELSTFRDCPLKWLLKYYWRLSGERQERLDLGTVWHTALETHYQCLIDGRSKLETLALVRIAINDGVELHELGGDVLERLLWMYDGYVSMWGSDPGYRPLALEEAFEFPLPVDGHPDLVLVGKIDAVMEVVETGAIELWDHKSASQRDMSKQAFADESLMEDQFLLYAAAKQRLGQKVARVIYNGARTDKLKRDMLDIERFARVQHPYNDASLEAVWTDASNAATALIRMWNDPESVYSVPNPRQCGWKCDFKPAHVDARATGRSVVDVALSYGMHQKIVREDQEGIPQELLPAGAGTEAGW